jgi:hypothetical protein
MSNKMDRPLVTVDGRTLMDRPLEPPNFVVDTLISQGLHILAGSPKVGKSWLALWLAVTVAKGEPVWGMSVKQGTTLYLCLEDSVLRIQNRLFEITEDAPDSVHFCTECAPIGQGLEEQVEGELFYYEMFRLLGVCEDTWSAYKKYIDRYMMYLHDIRAFVPTIRNFIKFILSTLTTNGPESYAAALYGFYNDDRTAEKLIVNPITYHGDCYRRHDEYMLSYVPRELPDGSMAICQEHVTDSLQALMKADYMLALNSGHNIRRCIICGKYFMLKSGVHALYCEGACPHAPGYICRQFGTVEVQKELAKNNPKVKAKLTAFSRITKDMQRGAISQEDARRAKDHVRDRLYDALRSPDISVEEFSEQVSTAQVYEYCRITRVSKPRGRPPKAKAGGTHDQ